MKLRNSSRRSAERVPFRAPVQIVGPTGPISAEIRDLSRTGIRFRLWTRRFPDLEGDLMHAASQLEGLIGKAPVMRLHPEMLGPLVSRKARVTRVLVPQNVEGAVDVGCSFDRPLSDDETAMLGVALQPERGIHDAALLRADVCAPSSRNATTPAPARYETPPAVLPNGDRESIEEPKRDERKPERAPEPPPPSADDTHQLDGAERAYRRVRYRTYVAGRGESISCDSEGLSSDGVLIRVPRSTLVNKGIVLDESAEMAEVAGGLGGLFGDSIRVRISDRGTHLWHGPAQVGAITMPDERPDVVLVELDFERALNPSERTRLGL